MSAQTEFITAIIDNASLAKARKKIPKLKWGLYHLLGPSQETACVMGVAALAACEDPQTIAGRDKLPLAVIERRGWANPGRKKLKTSCPQCHPLHNHVQFLAQSAVYHVNDVHGHNPGGLRGVIRTLRQWVKQELAAEG